MGMKSLGIDGLLQRNWAPQPPPPSFISKRVWENCPATKGTGIGQVSSVTPRSALRLSVGTGIQVPGVAESSYEIRAPSSVAGKKVKVSLTGARMYASQRMAKSSPAA